MPGCPAESFPACDGACEECASSTKCTFCRSRFATINSKCPGSSTCLSCSVKPGKTSLTCDECIPSTFLGGNPPTCKSCGPGCASCTAAGACRACAYQGCYGNVNGTCTRCAVAGCAIPGGTFFKPNVKKCSACAATLTLRNNTCVRLPCPVAKCANCAGGKCQDCVIGYFLRADGRCVPCVDKNCAQCITPNQCLGCKPGMGPVGGKCVPCKAGKQCLYCDQDVKFCSACQQGYGIIKGACVKCTDPNCLECNAASPSQCTACKPTFRRTRSYTCQKCNDPLCGLCDGTPSFCNYCKDSFGFVPGPTGTHTCKGFRLVDNGTCCQACKVPGCSFCNTAASVCEGCRSGSSLALSGTSQLCVNSTLAGFPTS
ncbi:hypothetical protein ACK3TF_003114 [Chlorella vulgaris]